MEHRNHRVDREFQVRQALERLIDACRAEWYDFHGQGD